MISLQNKLKQIGTALSEALPGIVFHYFSPTTFPYCVWAEDGESGSAHFDNGEREQALTGTVDYYTQTEYDENIDIIQNVLNTIMSNWNISMVQYEETTKLIHYTWDWTVINVG